MGLPVVERESESERFSGGGVAVLQPYLMTLISRLKSGGRSLAGRASSSLPQVGTKRRLVAPFALLLFVALFIQFGSLSRGGEASSSGVLRNLLATVGFGDDDGVPDAAAVRGAGFASRRSTFASTDGAPWGSVAVQKAAAPIAPRLSGLPAAAAEPVAPAAPIVLSASAAAPIAPAAPIVLAASAAAPVAPAAPIVLAASAAAPIVPAAELAVPPARAPPLVSPALGEPAAAPAGPPRASVLPAARSVTALRRSPPEPASPLDRKSVV